jgi:hypothetical protein
MDILFTLVASALMVIGFFVICRTVDDEEDQEIDEEANSSTSQSQHDVGPNDL